MKKLFLCALLGALCCGCAADTSRRDVDVLIVGGTTSGTSAAIAAARHGVSVLLVEPTPMLGGMLTAQGVSATDGNYSLHSGLWQEFREKLHEHYGGPEALRTGWVSNIQFEPHVADSIFKSLCAAEPQLEVLHGYNLADILHRDSRVTGAEFTDGDGKRLRVKARITIDATDLGDALPMCQTPYRLGMDS